MRSQMAKKIESSTSEIIPVQRVKIMMTVFM
jgi:ribosomal protein S3AE